MEGHSDFSALISRHTSIDCLPPELLALIFESFPHDIAAFSGTQVVISLSQVNRLWRNVTMSMHHLWTVIDVRHGSAEDLASRSSPLPINMTLFGPKSGWEFSDEGKRALIKLQRYADRVQTLHVSADAEVISAISSSFHLTALPLLTSLTLTSTWDAFIVEFSPIHSPHLRQLQLDSATVDLAACANLTHLYIDNNRCNFTGPELLLLLQRSPLLQMFSLLFVHIDEEDLSDTTTCVYLAHIKRLHLEGLESSFLEYLFRHLFIPSSAPLLENDSRKHSAATSRGTFDRYYFHPRHDFTLEVEYIRGTMKMYDERQPVVFNVSAVAVAPLILLTNGFVDLTPICALTLKIFDANETLSVDVWAAFCSHLPFLNRIQSECSLGFTQNLLVALWPDIDSPSSARNICPDLKHLHLDFNCNQSGIDSDFSQKFVLKRLKAGACTGRASLETLTIKIANGTCLSMANELRTFVNVLVIKT
jgi:hypothetical protein